MKTRTFFLLSVFITVNFCFGQTQVQKDLYNAFLVDSESKWANATKSYENIADQTKTTDLLQLIHCYYGWTSVQLDKKLNKEASININKAKLLIEKILKNEPNNPMALVYKGVFLGYEISLNNLKATTLGKESVDCINKAVKLAPNNPQIIYDKGNFLYYTPAIFGGNKKEAVKCYQKAISIIEKNNQIHYNWIYFQMLMLEAKSYDADGNYEKAKKNYEKILKLEPNYLLVKTKLYPELLKKMNK